MPEQRPDERERINNRQQQQEWNAWRDYGLSIQHYPHHADAVLFARGVADQMLHRHVPPELNDQNGNAYLVGRSMARHYAQVGWPNRDRLPGHGRG